MQPVLKVCATKLNPASERMVKKGHPWIFEKGILKVSNDPQTGDLCVIFDSKKNKFLAIGLYDADSVIRIKVLQFHTQAKIDAAWIDAKMASAFEKRAPLVSATSNSYRLINGENDGFPGMIIDVYAEVAVIKLYSAIWESFFNDILTVLKDAIGPTAIVLRLSRKLAAQDNHGWKDGACIDGILASEEVVFLEQGVRFKANVIKGHKTGFFLDHRQNRIKIGTMAKAKKVLDVFSYAGGFSVHALVGGANEVVSLDISKQALSIAEENVLINKALIKGRHSTMAVDAFEGLNNLIKSGKKFDVIIIDPPSFAKSAKEIPQAHSSYKRLAKLGSQLIADGGTLVLASCSSRVTADDFFQINQEVLEQASGRFRLEEKTFHDLDHPALIPEAHYLKCGYYSFSR